jgi:hypothetical protein
MGDEDIVSEASVVRPQPRALLESDDAQAEAALDVLLTQAGG